MPFALPTVFALEREGVHPTFNHLKIFPALSTNNSIVCRAIAATFHEDVSRRMLLGTTGVVQMSIWLKDFSEITLIRDIVEDIMIYFPHIAFLDFLLQYPSRTVSASFSWRFKECRPIPNFPPNFPCRWNQISKPFFLPWPSWENWTFISGIRRTEIRMNRGCFQSPRSRHLQMNGWLSAQSFGKFNFLMDSRLKSHWNR